ncbi:MAG TPA: hypothetical protein VNX47_04930 [Nevskia sp.]|nr:hypothetical protein [Nevskia sp.]
MALLGGAAVLSACGSSVAPAGATDTSCSSTGTWPSTALAAADAASVDPSQFFSADQLRVWGQDLDQRGLRATGTAPHETYIDELRRRLACAGVTQLSYESVPLTRWSVDSWSLAIASGPSAGPLQTAAYIPYSGSTPAQGVTAPLVYLDASTAPTAANAGGKIVLFDSPPGSLPMLGFELLALDTYDPNLQVNPTQTYVRPYLSQPTAILDQLTAAGAAGGIAIIPSPYATAHGAYFPYDRKLRGAPSLFVDMNVGAQLKALADGKTLVTLSLPATVQQVTTRNLIGIIPGASDELTVINSHTDGSNGIEDNGPNAIVGMAQYLVRLPKSALPRTIMLLLSSGHFAGGIGAEAFLAAHKSDGLLDRIASIVTIEHLGAQEWLPDGNGRLAPTGKPEAGAFFVPKNQALANASYAALKGADAGPSFVLPPLNANGDGTADNPVWPGEGQYFYGEGHVPTANYITGPYYLLNWGVTTADKIDFERMRREMISFTQMQLDLSRVSSADLHAASAVVLPAPP